MTVSRFPAAALAATLLLAAAGCGGKGTESGDAVIVPPPNANLTTSGSTPNTTPAAGTATETAPAAASSTAPPATTAASTGGFGNLKGQVTFAGTPPTPKEIAPKGGASKDPTVCAKDAPIVSEQLVVDAATKGVKNVLVYIPKPNGPINAEAKKNAQSGPIIFDQEKCVFVPHVLAVMVGNNIELKNSDPVSHNIDSKLSNNGFNSVVPASQSLPRSVSEPERGPGEVICDIHNWMKAYWLVLDNPYFAVTDEKGNFEIKNVPAGTQKVVVWQEAYLPRGFLSAQSGDAIAIKANETTTKDYKIAADKVRAE